MLLLLKKIEKTAIRFIFAFLRTRHSVVTVRTGPPVGVGIGSLPVTPNTNGEIGVLCVESDLAGVAQHNKT